MTRKTLLLDRLMTLVLALALLVGAAAAFWWYSGRSTWTTKLDVTPVRDLSENAWWPWATAVVGVVLVLVGLRWIAAHLRRQGVGQLHLAGSGEAGRLDAVAGKVAGAAADAFSDTLGVRSARGTVVRDRGQLVARIHAVIEPESDLRLLAQSADRVSAQLAQALGRDDVRCSVQLRVGRLARSLPRVG